ncbi:hypothetical protein FA15DRAFT_659336 [Coprinopsis marcescibilis]|uniref:Uncharacterized protein n=1 Tax=Coprinopsis marcescibilis TaxID=230819 RepID=A0A5C3KJU0_COPMA|nr:hypothetical protein FA15DRAFT_659336 [Coprinopsis marcescibilis]
MQTQREGSHYTTLPVELIEKVISELGLQAFPAYRVSMDDLDITPLPNPEALSAAFQCSLASHHFRAQLLPCIFDRITVPTLESLNSLRSLAESNTSLLSHVGSLELHEQRPKGHGDVASMDIPGTKWLISSSHTDPEPLSWLFASLANTGGLREISMMQYWDISLDSDGVNVDHPRLSKPFPGPLALRVALRSLLLQPQLRALHFKLVLITMEAVEWIYQKSGGLQYLNASYIALEREAYTSGAECSSSIWEPITKLGVRKRLYQLPFTTAHIACQVPTEISRLPLLKLAHRIKQVVGKKKGKDPEFVPPLPNLERLVLDVPVIKCKPQGYDKSSVLAPKLRTMVININHNPTANLSVSELKFNHLCVDGPFENLEILRFIGPGPIEYRFLFKELQDEVPGDISTFLSGGSHSDASRPCKLKTLKITFKCSDPSLFVTPLRPLPSHMEENVGWVKLDDVLAGPFFGRLSRVVVNVARFGISNREVLEVEKSIKYMMPKVQEVHGVSIQVES